MGKIIELTHDDVQNELAYALICETMEGAYWNSGRRRRMFSKNYTLHHSPSNEQHFLLAKICELSRMGIVR